jgi:hypothetical protein
VIAADSDPADYAFDGQLVQEPPMCAQIGQFWHLEILIQVTWRRVS